ncbi:MAG: PLP-dependent aminotransferase family protein [Pseudonocardia sp.]
MTAAPAGSRAAPPAARVAPLTAERPLVDLRAGGPCTEIVDAAAWRRAWRAAGDAPPDGGPCPAGLPAFRVGVVEHLLRHRGLPADPADVLATGGSTSAISELARVLPVGARVAMEEPGYQRGVWALAAAGVRVVPVAVDDAGLMVDALPPGLAAVYCTPAHQYPLGARLAADRRVALVERARAEGWLVIEDDYDGELRYDVAPMPLLAALGPDVVAHLGTASKMLTPTLGVGWLVAPPAVRRAVFANRERTGARPAPAGQRVFAALAAHGDLARHLRRLRRELVARRASVIAALDGAGVQIRGDEAGAHVVAVLADSGTERAAVAAAAESGVALDGLARHHVGPPATAGIVLGYAGPSSSDLERALPVVTSVLGVVRITG